MTAVVEYGEPLAVAHQPDPRDAVVQLEAVSDTGRITLIAGDVAAGVVAAHAVVGGVPSVLFATDGRRQGGALGTEGCDVIVTAYRHALLRQQPVVGIWQSGGARLGEGALSLDGVGRVFAAMTAASGRVAQLSLIVGSAAGGAAYGPALTDIVVMAPGGKVFVTGPDVVRRVTGEQVDGNSLGGQEVHSRHSGVAHLALPSDEAAIASIRDLVGLLGRQGHARATIDPPIDPGGLLPESRRRAYDVRPILRTLLDADAPSVELHPGWGRNIITTLGRLGGRSVGVVASQPLRLGGCLNATAAEKAARFVRLCDANGLPVITIVDVPGYLPGARQEAEGVVRRGAKLVHAYAAASVPLITLVTRKAYGGAYIAMASRSLGADRVFAWPDAEIGVMGPEGAIEIIHRRTLEPLTGLARDVAATVLADDYRRDNVGITSAIANGLVDEIVEPVRTRQLLIESLSALDSGVRGRLGNIPL